MQECQRILGRLLSGRRDPQLMRYLTAPVDTQLYPEYAQVVCEPMDLGTVAERLKSGHYETPSDFARDVRLVFANCYKFNGRPSEGHSISMFAAELEHQFERMYASLPQQEQESVTPVVQVVDETPPPDRRKPRVLVSKRQLRKLSKEFLEKMRRERQPPRVDYAHLVEELENADEATTNKAAAIVKEHHPELMENGIEVEIERLSGDAIRELCALLKM